MPRLTRLFIKSAFAYLVFALLAGAVLASRSMWTPPVALQGLSSAVYYHLFLVGWVGQLIFGVVYWMFPVHTKAQPHGNEKVWWATFWLLNVGLVLRVVAEPLATGQAESGWGWLLALSALLQLAAGLLFAANTWRRVKGR